MRATAYDMFQSDNYNRGAPGQIALQPYQCGSSKGSERKFENVRAGALAGHFTEQQFSPKANAS